MNYAQLLEDVKFEATKLFQNMAGGPLPYHNLDHTLNVVSKAAAIARHYELGDGDFFIVVTAAWFHDTGYLNGPAKDHELRSAAVAESFLQGKGFDAEGISKVRNCILATRLPQQPATRLEQIVCDADLFHFGTGDFKELNKKMKKEAEMHYGRKIEKEEWRTGTLKLLEAHHFHTDYAQSLLNKTKEQNVNSIREKLLGEEKEGIKVATTLPGAEATKTVAVGDKKTKRPDRGIETMFRISSNNHQRLSDMADNKANIMITTTSIILSVLLSVLLRKLEDNHHLIIPAILLLSVCVITMVFSILATRPAIPNGRFTKQDIDDKKTNLLFFGNFYRMSYEEYSGGMEAMMNDRDFLYGSLTRDVYSQGIVLGRKYRLLRLGYNVFMYGIICSVLAFVIAVMWTMYQ